MFERLDSILVESASQFAEPTGLALARVKLITGGVLLALLAICGNWLIGRGLAPLDRMASTADMITSSGDLAARMPDANAAADNGSASVCANSQPASGTASIR